MHQREREVELLPGPAGELLDPVVAVAREVELRRAAPPRRARPPRPRARRRGRTARSARRRSACPRPSGSAGSSRACSGRSTSPPSRFSSPTTICISVLLPDPFSPTRPTSSPAELEVGALQDLDRRRRGGRPRWNDLTRSLTRRTGALLTFSIPIGALSSSAAKFYRDKVPDTPLGYIAKHGGSHLEDRRRARQRGHDGLGGVVGAGARLRDLRRRAGMGAARADRVGAGRRGRRGRSRGRRGSAPPRRRARTRRSRSPSRSSQGRLGRLGARLPVRVHEPRLGAGARAVDPDRLAVHPGRVSSAAS